MTILCLVLGQRDGSWAVFSDCLITSDLHDEGISLSTPLRYNYENKEIIGFSESALEEKIGFIGENTLFGWAGDRGQAVKVHAELREYDFINIPNKIFCEDRSCYFFARRNEDGRHTKKFIGPSDLMHRIVSCGYEFIFTGSGSEILHGLSFTAHHRPLGKDAKNAVSAAVGAIGRFFSEEMAGQDSQFYSLRTGGHYRVFYGSPEGIKQLYFSINHWSIGPDDEPVVSRIVIPFEKDGFELSVGLNVETGWKMDSCDAVALAPLLESPRIKKDIQFNLIDVLNSELADFTFHICWRPDQHNVFVIPGQEPKFKVSDREFRKIAHQDITIAKVKELLSG